MKMARRFLIMAKKHWGELALAIFGLLGATLMNLVTPEIVRRVTAYLSLPDTPQMRVILTYAAILAASYLLRAVFRFISMYVSHVAAWSFVGELTLRIYDKLQQDDIPVEQIAGIPAFIASGAMAGLHIVSQEERLIVIPGHVTAKELDDYLKHQTVVVIMKLSQCIDEVHQCIINHPEYQYHYFENVGTEKEYYSCSTEELREKRYPYFSVMIIRFG